VGFTLIELSIVLVIIGLIVGGVLVGQDLIRAAYVRAQITQIEKFNTAVNTFYGKYQALPGDMNLQTAQQFGFSSTGGNGDGIIGGQTTGSIGGMGFGSNQYASNYVCGEAGEFWVDLSSQTAGNLIEGGFTTATESCVVEPSGTFVGLYYPTAKLGNGNYIFVTSMLGINYYAISQVIEFVPPLVGAPAITVAQAYNIDRKVDDGTPTTGNVVAIIFNAGPNWSIGGGSLGAHDSYIPSGSPFSGVAATAGNATSSETCFDAPTVGGPTNYSMEQNGGAGLNCALVFKMQGGD
jgi:prepilin-type N-terminal cleavage/methylation domain-containing protein